LVTGGGSGIGAATALALGRLGVTVVVAGRREDRLAAVVARLETPGVAVAADLTDPDAPERLVAGVVERFGRLDVLAHAAGVFEKRPVDDTDPEFWASVLDVNLSAAVQLTRFAWPHLQAAAGQVVLVSSAAAGRGFPENSAYAASKGGLNAFGEVLRVEGRDDGIRVLTVCPAQTDTDLWDGKAPPAVRAAMMRADGVGDVIASLVASDRSIDYAPIWIQPPDDPWSAEP
jgi:NAD(P)-dependent dehydrogenase (short-subunit alcohol dehydrogenase family)